MNNELPVMLPWKAQLNTFDQPDGFTCDRWLHGVENYSHLAQKMLKPHFGGDLLGQTSLAGSHC